MPRRRACAGANEGAIADQARTEQRRGACVRKRFGNGYAVALIRDGELGVPAVERVAGELRLDAQIFPARAAIEAFATGPAEPWDADALSDTEQALARSPHASDAADDLVAQDERKLGVGQLAVDHVQVRAADVAQASTSS